MTDAFKMPLEIQLDASCQRQNDVQNETLIINFITKLFLVILFASLLTVQHGEYSPSYDIIFE